MGGGRHWKKENMKLRKEDFHFFKPLEAVGIAIYEGIINICLYNNYNRTIKVCNWMINGHSGKIRCM